MTRQEFDVLTEKERRGAATPEELAALEPYRVRRAIFMAAGFGSRMAPLTERIPKPLVPVFGKPLIETQLDAMLAAGIEEIYIVRGYLASAFDVLLEKYPMIRFLDNHIYNETNSISSILLAAKYLPNAYVCEADMLLSNPALITKYQYESNFLGVPVSHTDDWCYTVEDGIIRSVQMGGDDCYHQFVVSYWTKEDGERLAGHLKEAFQAPGGRNIFFEAVPLNIYTQEYNVHVRPCTFDDILEIDTLEELKALDPSYL